jgi:hypothetical protein
MIGAGEPDAHGQRTRAQAAQRDQGRTQESDGAWRCVI